ncbi:unnamed protein product [Clavelina lepadiformis]|uniref:Uncharacterized protein n=1 Tax=Clavelina lepadiformis TaxID=159417 RepID=A0ABP0G9S0_CLALP
MSEEQGERFHQDIKSIDEDIKAGVPVVNSEHILTGILKQKLDREHVRDISLVVDVDIQDVFFFFRMRSAQMYSATNSSHLLPSPSGLFRSSWPMGGRRTRQLRRMCSAVCDSAPQMHDGDALRPQRCMHSPKRPTPVLSRFRVVQAFRGRSAPAGEQQWRA